MSNGMSRVTPCQSRQPSNGWRAEKCFESLCCIRCFSQLIEEYRSFEMTSFSSSLIILKWKIVLVVASAVIGCLQKNETKNNQARLEVTMPHNVLFKGTPGYRIKLILNNRHQNEINNGVIQKFVAKSCILNLTGQFFAYLSFGPCHFPIE